MLTIVSVGYPFAQVRPEAVGGAEQVLAAIDAGLTARGHRSIVIAPAGSQCAGELRAIPEPPTHIDAEAFRVGHAAIRRQIDQALRRDAPDVVHLHGVDFHHYIPFGAAAPVLVTLHLWPTAYPAWVFEWTPDGVHLQCVSEAQRRACLARRRPLLIRNGIRLDWFSPAPRKDDYVLALGRICPEKGFHLAIDAAQEAGVPIVVAGAVFPHETHRRYFEDSIKPRLGHGAQFVGPVDGAVKKRLLAGARCVALASTVPETSSLVAMEALASGTPVVALRSPALEELIEDGRTGWLVEAPGEMARAFQRAGILRPTACRAAAEQRCSAVTMVRAYLDCYQSMAGGVDHSRAASFG